MCLAQGIAEQVTPLGGQTVAGDLIDLHPSIYSQTAFGDDQVNMRFEAEVAAEGMDGVDHADAHIWIEIFQDFTDGLSRDLQDEFQQRAVGEEERSQEVIGGDGDVQVGHIEHVFGDIVDPGIHAELTARGAKACFAGEGDTMLILAAWAYLSGIAALRVTAEHHTLNDVSDVSLLIEGDFVGQTQVAVALPVVEKYLPKAVMPGGAAERAGRGEFDSEVVMGFR